MKTILYLHSSSDLYGSDRCLLRTIEGLDSTQSHAVVCLPYDGPLVGALRKSGATVYVLDMPMLRRQNLSLIGIYRFFVSLVSGMIRVRKIMKLHRVDLLHSNTAAVTLGGILARRFGVLHIWHVREIIVSPVFVRKFISKSVMRGATLVVGVSASVINNLALDQPGILEKSRVIYDGIQTADFVGGKRSIVRGQVGVSERNILVGMLGRVGSWKGQELLLEAAIRIREQGKEQVRFVAVGSAFQGNEGAMIRLHDLISRSEMSELFSVLEFRTDVNDILAALDIFVLPSILPDPFPNTVLEAMAAGKPVVANAHGGVVEMLHDGESGFLISPNDAEQMAARIALLAGDAELRSRMGMAAQLRALNLFDISVYRKTMNALYDELLAGQPL